MPGSTEGMIQGLNRGPVVNAATSVVAAMNNSPRRASAQIRAE